MLLAHPSSKVLDYKFTVHVTYKAESISTQTPCMRVKEPVHRTVNATPGTWVYKQAFNNSNGEIFHFFYLRPSQNVQIKKIYNDVQLEEDDIFLYVKAERRVENKIAEVLCTVVIRCCTHSKMK